MSNEKTPEATQNSIKVRGEKLVKTPNGQIMTKRSIKAKRGAAGRVIGKHRLDYLSILERMRTQIGRMETIIDVLEDKIYGTRSAMRYVSQWQVWAIDGGVGTKERFVTAYKKKKLALAFVHACYEKNPPDTLAQEGTTYKLRLEWIPARQNIRTIPDLNERIELTEEELQNG